MRLRDCFDESRREGFPEMEPQVADQALRLIEITDRVGLLRDALTPASFGAGALAHTLVGFMSSWAKAVFFAEHVFVKGCLFFAGTWLRNFIVLLVSGRLQSSQVAWELLVWSPLQGLTTAVVGVAVLWFFRGWLSPRRPGATGVLGASA